MNKERLHHALGSSDLGWSDVKTKDIDILTALGMTDRQGALVELGGKLIYLKTATHSKSLFVIPGSDLHKKLQKEACEALSEEMRFHPSAKGVKYDARLYLATMAITEFIYDLCQSCGGAGQIKNAEGGVIVTCMTCRGTGKRRYSDQERLETLQDGNKAIKPADLKARYQVTWERMLMVMHGIIGFAERAKMGATNDMLERY